MRRLIVLLALLLAALPARAADLVVTFIDVGQGDAALVTSPTGKRVLIDGGPPEGQAALLRALQARRVDSLDLILLTHPHLDHLGGLERVVRAVPVRNYMDPAFSHPSPAYTALLRALQERGVTVRQAEAGRKIDLGGGAVLTLLGPPRPFLANTRSDVNANSAVGRLTYGQVAALFAADAEPETEAWLLSQGVPLQAQLLKVPHHGGKYSSTAPFLRAVAPQIAVISVGAHNDYGHPTPAAMSRLAAAGARIYRTDQQGDITVRSDGRHWVVDSTGGAAPPAAAPAPPAPDRAAAPAAAYVASRRSAVFHRAECPAVAHISPQNLLRFPSREAALASGRQPAGDCHP